MPPNQSCGEADSRSKVTGVDQSQPRVGCQPMETPLPQLPPRASNPQYRQPPTHLPRPHASGRFRKAVIGCVVSAVRCSTRVRLSHWPDAFQQLDQVFLPRSVALRSHGFRARMPAGTLAEKQQACGDECRDHSRGERSAERQAPLVARLVKEIPDGRAQWPGQNESEPKQENARHRRPVIQASDQSESQQENESAALVAEAAGVRHPIAESGAERL